MCEFVNASESNKCQQSARLWVELPDIYIERVLFGARPADEEQGKQMSRYQEGGEKIKKPLLLYFFFVQGGGLEERDANKSYSSRPALARSRQREDSEGLQLFFCIYIYIYIYARSRSVSTVLCGRREKITEREKKVTA